MDRLGINTQTLFGMPPVDHVNLAADLGCGHISTGLSPVPWKREQFPDWSLRDDPRLQRELRAALKDRGIAIAFAEGCIVRPQVEVSSYAADLDLFAELGAQGVSTVCMEPDRGRALRGTTLPIRPKKETKDWADESPNITSRGLASKWSEGEMIKFLMTGIDPEGKKARAPMPAFRFNASDARAIYLYLQSVPGANEAQHPEKPEH